MIELGGNDGVSFGFVIKNSDHGWLNYDLVLKYPGKVIVFSSIHKQATTNLGTSAEIGKFAFALKPFNELHKFHAALLALLESKIPYLCFEPFDPSFEIEITAIGASEFKIQLWVDAGNTRGLEYSWDAMGMRFVTTADKLKNFCDQLLSNSTGQ